MTASTFQLLGLHNTQANHSTSLTLYSYGQTAKPGTFLPRLAERKRGGKQAILPTNMTNGIGSGTSESIVTSEKQKRNNSKQGNGKVFVSYLQTSLSTNWKRSLSQESNEKASQKQTVADENDMSSQHKNISNAKRMERSKAQGRGDAGQNATSRKGTNTTGNIDSNPSGSKRKAPEQRQCLEQQDSNISIQQGKGKQLSFISENTNTGASSVASYSETDLNAPKPRMSYVYIKSKFNALHGNMNTVFVQKSPLCRSITISEASLSSAMTRQAMANISFGSRSRNTSSRKPAISVQNKNKRSFTISNDTTDGRLRTIYESTLEENCD